MITKIDSCILYVLLYPKTYFFLTINFAQNDLNKHEVKIPLYIIFVVDCFGFICVSFGIQEIMFQFPW